MGASLFHRLDSQQLPNRHQRPSLSHRQPLPQGARGLLLDPGSGLPLLCSHLSLSFHSIQSKSQIAADISELPVCDPLTSPCRWPPFCTATQAFPTHMSLTFDPKGLLSTLLYLYARVTLAVPVHLVLNCQPSPHVLLSLGHLLCDFPPLESITTDMPKGHPFFSLSTRTLLALGRPGSEYPVFLQCLVLQRQLLLNEWECNSARREEWELGSRVTEGDCGL